jgi:chromosome segregation ATPase
MVCSMVKKGLLGAALSAGALFLVFGTSAPSYVRTGFHKIRHNVKAGVPVQFEIDRARDEIANLEPAIIENREMLARAEVDVEHLEADIAATRSNLAVEKRELLSLREGFQNGDLRLAGHTSITPDEIRTELASRLDHYRAVTKRLEDQEGTLKSRQKAMQAGRVQYANLITAKKNLTAKLEGIEAKLKMIEATQGKNEFTFDDSALSRAKQTVADLEKRLEVKARMAEMEGRFSETGGLILEPSRDVVREIDAEFGGPAKGHDAKTADKSL